MDIILDGKIKSLCQHIRKLDISDDEIIHVLRDGAEVFKPYPASKWKSISVSETDSHGPRFIKYKPNPLWGTA